MSGSTSEGKKRGPKGPKADEFMKKLNKVPVSERYWDVLKAPGDPDVAERVGKPPGRKGCPLRAGETEVLWNRYDFENDMFKFIMKAQIPEFLLSSK